MKGSVAFAVIANQKNFAAFLFRGLEREAKVNVRVIVDEGESVNGNLVDGRAMVRSEDKLGLLEEEGLEAVLEADFER